MCLVSWLIFSWMMGFVSLRDLLDDPRLLHFDSSTMWSSRCSATMYDYKCLTAPVGENTFDSRSVVSGVVSWSLLWATHGLPNRAPVCRGCPCRDPPCATESRVTLWQSANPSCCGCWCCWSRDVVWSLRSRSTLSVQLRILAPLLDWKRCSSSQSSSFSVISTNFQRVVGVFFNEILSQQILIDTFFISLSCSRSHRTFLACCVQCRNLSCSLECKSVSFSEDPSTSVYPFRLWVILQSSRRETRCTPCQQCCEHPQLSSECQASNGTGGSQRGRLCFRMNRRWSARWYASSSLFAECSWLWGLPYDESCHDLVRVPSVDFLLQECKVLDHLFLNDWNRVLECVHDPYQLGLRFAEVLRFIFGLHLLGCQIELVLNGKLVDTVGDMLVDLTQSDLDFVERFLARDIVDFCDVLWASVSVEHVRLDLELTAVVQHCPNLVDLRRAKLTSLCWSPSLLQTLLTFAAIGFRLQPPIAFLIEAGGMISWISYWRHSMLQALAASLTILTTASLRVSRSSKVFSGVMRVILDRIVSCTNRNCGFSIFFWTLWTEICFCFTLWNWTLWHLFSVVCSLLFNWNPPLFLWIESETSRLLLLISTWTVGLVSALSRECQQPCWWTAAGQLNCLLRQPGRRELFCACLCGPAFTQSHRRSVRRFTLTWALSADNRLRWCIQCHTTHNAALLLVADLLAANSETQVAPTFIVEDSLLLVVGPELCWTRLRVHLDFVVLRHAVFVLFLWCLLGVASQRGHRVNVLKQWDTHRSRCLLNHKHLSLHYHTNVRSVLFEILLGCGQGLPLVAVIFSCWADWAPRSALYSATSLHLCFKLKESVATLTISDLWDHGLLDFLSRCFCAVWMDDVPSVSSPNPSVDAFPRILTCSPLSNKWSSFVPPLISLWITSVSFCTVKLWFLYSTISTLKSIVGMVLNTSPSFSSCCPCWTSASVIGCFWTAWLQLSSVMCFSSYFALSWSKSFGSLCLLLAVLFFCPLLALLFSVLFIIAPDLRCSARAVLVPLLLYFILFTTGSLVFRFGCGSHHWLFGCGSVCASSSESLCGSLRLRGSFLASPHTTTKHCATSWLMARGKCPRSTGKLFTTTCSAVCEVWSERFAAPAARRWSPLPLCDTVGCVHPRNEGFHRGLLSRRGPLGRPASLGVFLYRLVSLTENHCLSCQCHTLLPFTCSDDFLSLSGMHAGCSSHASWILLCAVSHEASTKCVNPSFLVWLCTSLSAGVPRLRHVWWSLLALFHSRA